MRHTGMMLWAEIFVLVALATCVAVGFVYIALDDPPTDHLMGGELSVSLVRTGLATCLPEQDGRLITRFMNNEKDFSHATGESVFGEEARTAPLVPGCFLDATLVIQNTGDTAFAFFVELSYPEEAKGTSVLAEQLTVHITHPDGSVTQAPLAELPNGQLLTQGELARKDSSARFAVRIEFVDCAENNAAAGQSLDLDLVVRAVELAE